MSFIITESPAKAKKIQGFLGSGYTVKSSVGHIRGIDTKWANTNVVIDEDIKVPYIILKDKNDVVKSLKSASKGLNIILAADDDREGEAIAWHCGQILNVDFNEMNRIKYREISKKAIVNAIKNPMKVNINEVNAQQARAVIDLLVGYKLSPCLWRHIKTEQKGLSAGRVQSALLNLLEEHDRKIKDFEPEWSFDIQGDFKDLEKSEFLFLSDPDLDEKYIKKLFKKFSKDRIFKVENNIKSEEKSYPDKPFITSSLQQCSQNSFGYSVKKTMSIAQKLYENGKITYMRTDSEFISEDFCNTLSRHINEKFGTEYFNKPRVKKVKGAQEAHEAIRPTDINNTLNDNYSEEDKKIYNLILKRTIQSHMKPAIYTVNTVQLNNSNTKDIGYFTSKQKEIKFKGYLVYNDNSDDNKIIPFKNKYELNECICTDKSTNPPQPYNEAQIVKLLENTGIGRPSTYSTIISTLYNRNYTEVQNIKLDDKTEDIIILKRDNNIIDDKRIQKGSLLKNKIIVTDLGKTVLTYLQKNFTDIIHKDFTVNVEKDLDLISQGKLIWYDIVKKVYNSFIDIVNEQMKLGNITKKSSNIEKLGEIKGEEVFKGNGKYGPYICYKKKFTNIKKYLETNNKTLEDITLDDCKDFIKYPMKINKDITIHLGPYGTYMKYKGKNIKIKQDIEYTKEYCLGLV